MFTQDKVNNKNLTPILTLFLDCQMSLSFCFPSLCTPHPQLPPCYPWHMSLGFWPQKSVMCLVIGARALQSHPEQEVFLWVGTDGMRALGHRMLHVPWSSQRAPTHTWAQVCPCCR